MTRIKVCGITRLEDAKVAASLGVDAVGFIFYPHSKRFITPQDAAGIIRQIPPFITTVGVFVDEALENIIQIKQHTGISTVQLHGSETPEFCAQVPGRIIKAFRVSADFSLAAIRSYPDISAFLLDAWDETLKGGTGHPIDWKVAAQATLYGNLVLAGGLNPSNLKEAVEIVAPYAVDLNSGIEIMPGQKNKMKMKQAVDIVRSLDPSR